MKTVTSQDNLTAYLDRNTPQIIDPASLNRKIKSIKSALKVSERHNQDLHLKIKSLKQQHQLELLHLQNQLRKQRQLYEMLTSNYDLRTIELKDCKKKLKRAQAQQQIPQISLEQAEQTGKEYRQAILKQEKEMARLREENRLLYDQLYDRSSRIRDLQHHSRSRSKVNASHNQEHKDKNFLLHLRKALESKNQQFERVQQQKSHLSSAKQLLEKQVGQLSLRVGKLSVEADFERKSAVETKQKAATMQKQNNQVKAELRDLSGRYNQLLNFSYELQRDFERDLQAALKELSRKESRDR